MSPPPPRAQGLGFLQPISVVPGLRFTHEDKDAQGTSVRAGPLGQPMQAAPGSITLPAASGAGLSVTRVR